MNTDTERLNYLEELIAAHEGGDTVTLSYDDATFEHTLFVGRKSRLEGYGRGLRAAIDEAMTKGPRE